MKTTRASVAVGATFFFTAVAAQAHPDHGSRGEAVLNPETGHLEVSLRVDAAALARAVQRHDGQRWSWGAQDAQQRVEAYVASRFRVTTDRGVARLVMAGWEPDGPRLWIHFEMRSVAQLHGATIANTVLFDVEPTQRNALQLRSGAFRRSLLFDQKHTEHRVDTMTR